MRPGLAVLLLPALLLAAPEKELIREEPFNYRIVGKLPAGWKRRDKKLSFAFSIDGIPHAYVVLVRERLRGTVDVEEQVRKRAPHYRFPGAPKEAKETVRTTVWAGRSAVLYEHETEIKGVSCRRRVTALFAKSIWYELIETIHGAETEDEPACAAGLYVFRRGFRLLVEPLPAAETETLAESGIFSTVYGFTMLKPKGFKRLPVDTGQDPGCRLAFEAQAAHPHRHIRIRLFEYGVRRTFDPAAWLDIFFTGFATLHLDVQRTDAEAPTIQGAKDVVATEFTGVRDKRKIRTLVILMHAEGGRVLALRIRTQDGAETDFADAIRAVIAKLQVR
ncbi:MAG: hypothetical protein ACYS0K_08235 [Planctomycetota bacterium]